MIAALIVEMIVLMIVEMIVTMIAAIIEIMNVTMILDMIVLIIVANWASYGDFVVFHFWDSHNLFWSTIGQLALDGSNLENMEFQWYTK